MWARHSIGLLVLNAMRCSSYWADWSQKLLRISVFRKLRWNFLKYAPGGKPQLNSTSGQSVPTCIAWYYISPLLRVLFLHLTQETIQLRQNNCFFNWKIVVTIKSLIWFSFFSSNMYQNLTVWGICAKTLVIKAFFSILNKILHNDNGYTMNTKFIHFSPFNSCLLQFCSLNFLTWWNSC